MIKKGLSVLLIHTRAGGRSIHRLGRCVQGWAEMVAEAEKDAWMGPGESLSLGSWGLLITGHKYGVESQA